MIQNLTEATEMGLPQYLGSFAIRIANSSTSD